MRKKKDKKNLEVYFVIYLSAIISFFAVESQVRIYKKNQDKLIIESSKDKLKDLIQIDKHGSAKQYIVWDDNFTRLKLDASISGDFEVATAEFFARFTYSDTTISKDTSFNFPLVSNINESSHYSVEIDESVFGNYKLKARDLSIVCNFKPSFTEETRAKWIANFESKSVAEKIISKILKAGRVPVEKEIATSLVPDFVQTQFDVTFDKDTETVLKGVIWKIPINIGGVYDRNDFSIDVVSGRSLFTELVKDRPRSYLIGTGRNNGNIVISAIRAGDGEKKIASVSLLVYEPQYEVNMGDVSIYIDETFNFDARIKEVESNRITVTVEDEINNRNINYRTANFVLGPYKSEGNIKVKVNVDNNYVASLDREIMIRKPPAPDIELLSRSGLTLQFTVTVYGKENALTFEFAENGLSSLKRLPDANQPHENVREYQLTGTMRPPFQGQGNEIEVEFFVKDKYGKTKEFSQIFVLQN